MNCKFPKNKSRNHPLLSFMASVSLLKSQDVICGSTRSNLYVGHKKFMRDFDVSISHNLFYNKLSHCFGCCLMESHFNGNQLAAIQRMEA